MLAETKQGYWKGKHLSEEHKLKLSLSNRGQKRTQETKDRIRQAMLRHEVSEETRRRTSIAQRKRHKESEAILMRMSAAQKKRYSSTKQY